MIELTLGALAAALVAKVFDRAQDTVVDQGEGVLGRLVEMVRERLPGANNEEGPTVLEKVEEASDSPSRIEALAHLLDKQADNEPEFRRALKALVEEARGAGVDVTSITQVAYGNQAPQFANISDSEINLIFGSVADPSHPRRISD
jgi:nucleotide-binding universal stress UspA family protein